MSWSFVNAKKKGSIQGLLETRLLGLDNKWSDIVNRHRDILDIKTKDHASLDYFKKKSMQSAEEVYLDERSQTPS